MNPILFLDRDDITRLRRKARNIEIEAARAPGVLAGQLRSLAALYHAEADQLAAPGLAQTGEPAMA